MRLNIKTVILGLLNKIKNTFMSMFNTIESVVFKLSLVYDEDNGLSDIAHASGKLVIYDITAIKIQVGSIQSLSVLKVYINTWSWFKKIVKMPPSLFLAN